MQAGENVFDRDEFHGPGVDFVETPLNLRLPRGVNLGFAGAVAGLEEFPDQPIQVAWG
jgi:hypothetical protein